jgi:hypothetical protein
MAHIKSPAAQPHELLWGFGAAGAAAAGSDAPALEPPPLCGAAPPPRCGAAVAAFELGEGSSAVPVDGGVAVITGDGAAVGVGVAAGATTICGGGGGGAGLSTMATPTIVAHSTSAMAM